MSSHAAWRQPTFAVDFQFWHEQSGWITSEWRTSKNKRRAKYYKLTPAGRRQLAKEEQSWDRVVQGVASILRFA